MFQALPFDIHPSTRWVGKPLLYLPEVDSTNRLLRERASEGVAAEGTVILTEHQRAGRGRQGRQWNDVPGTSLLFSLLLTPPALTAQDALLPLVTAVAGARALERHLGLAPEIKWPNDLRLDGRKVAGILLESEMAGPGRPLIVVGMGLNVNQEAAALAGLPEATSLRLHQGSPVERGPLLATLLEELERAYDAFRGGWQPHAAWRRRAGWLGGAIVVHPSSGEPWEARAVELNPDGSLQVRRVDGTRMDLHAGDVSVRPH